MGIKQGTLSKGVIMEKTLIFRWSVSRGQDSYGYNICSLWVDRRKVSSTCGGGYDMKGTALGNWMQHRFKAELLTLEIPMNRRNSEDIQEYYGLTFHDPNFDPGKAVVDHPPVFGKEEDKGKTVAELEKEGKSLGLERYQQFHKASSRVPTARHIIPLLDGACGFSSMEIILKALGYRLKFISESRNESTYLLLDKEKAKV